MRTVDNPEDKSCDLVTKELELTPYDLKKNDLLIALFAPVGVYTTRGVVISLLLISVISTTSVVVSGSIAIVGNTIHWLEKQAKCDDSTVENAAPSLN